jgi:hypothetical protein
VPGVTVAGKRNGECFVNAARYYLSKKRWAGAGRSWAGGNKLTFLHLRNSSFRTAAHFRQVYFVFAADI